MHKKTHRYHSRALITAELIPAARSDSSVPANRPENQGQERSPEAENLRGHIIATLAWIAVTAACVPIVGYARGWKQALDFITAYMVEYSLSIDNLFIFLHIFSYFKVPHPSRKRVLTWGILGALLMRGVMILAGAELARRFEVVTVFFGILLIFSAFKIFFQTIGDDEKDVSQNKIVGFMWKIVQVNPEFHGDRFFTIRNGVRVATPLFLVLLCIEMADIVFALDSVPAVLSISNDIFVIYLSNILAIQGLRSMFFILADSICGLRYLSKSLALVLAFLGIKMIAAFVGWHVSTLASLAFIVGTLGLGVGLSIAFPDPCKSV